jgi:hypothetical protein
MKKLLVSLAISFFSMAAPAHELVAASGDTRVRITSAPCESKLLPVDVVKTHMTAIVDIKGKTYPGCWILVGGNVLISFEDGDIMQIPTGAFKPAKTV